VSLTRSLAAGSLAAFPEEMGLITNDLVSYDQQPTDTLKRLFTHHPAMRNYGTAGPSS